LICRFGLPRWLMVPAPTVKGRRSAMVGRRNGPAGPETPERDKLTGVLVPAGSLELSVEEVRQLWSFIHGDIMDGSARRLLGVSLGLCPRHAWAYAVVEVELWQAGAGARGGHQPFDVTVLYDDLLDHVAEGWSGRARCCTGIRRRCFCRWARAGSVRIWRPRTCRACGWVTRTPTPKP
jgi:hypothetical protein